MSSLFPPGRIVATPGALDALNVSGPALASLLARHLSGDWGTLDAHDRQANDAALRDGSRLLSAYMLDNGTKVWVITEGDRSSTCVLLPSEY
jgi:hypothetical protein